MLRQLNVRNVLKYSQCCYSTANVSTAAAKLANSDEKKDDTNVSSPPKEHSQLIATAFASLKEISLKSRKRTPSEVEQQIYLAQDVDTLLSVVDSTSLTRPQALKIVSTLANWANQGKIKLTAFEMDIRFAKLCRLLGRSKNSSSSEDMADLSVVLGVTADEHAAKLVSSISLQQMINILSSLGMKKRRSLPLLRSLAFNIGRSTETLTVKQASDIFYNIAVLNYPDEVLLEKVCSDIRNGLNDIRKSSVIWSLITSFGILRYKDTDLLEHFHTWIISNQNICKTKDFLSMLITSASVHYISPNFDRFFEIMKPWLKENEMVDIGTWIDVVWSLTVLNKIDENTLNSALNPAFIERLLSTRSCRGEDGDVSVSIKLKLLNINGAAKLMGNTYKGSLLDENSDIYKVPLTRPKEKQMLLDSALESMSNFVKIDECLQLDVDSGMGFVIDAVCYVDPKGKVVNLNAKSSKKNKKIAIMMNSYHDFCRGCHYELTGLVALTHRLLNDSGYTVVAIPYTEFDARDKLVNRVQYLNQRLKEAAS